MNSQDACQTIEYHVDGQGLLIYVSDSWTQFALDNSSPHLVAERVIGKPLVSFISDMETRYLYHIILERVRSTEVPVVVTLRCDSSSLRRFLELVISPLPGQDIQFSSRTLRTEPREPVPLLDPNTHRSDEYLRMCSWCKRILVSDDQWVEVEEAVTQLELFHLDALPDLTHGVCPDCYVKVKEEFLGK
jgi:hypothetical protein